MVKEAEVNAEADKKKRETIDTKNNADAMIHQVEKSLEEFGDKISDTEKTAIQDDIKSLKESIESDDIEKIKKGTEALTQSSMKIGEAMAKAQQQDAQPDASSSPKQDSGKQNEKVVDAEFEEVKDDTKQA